MRASFASLTVAMAAANFMFSSPAAARPTSIRALAALEVRLATIAYRIAVANPQVCQRREILTGLVLHDLSRYDRAIRPAVSRAFSVAGGFGVLGIVPGSVAAKAGLRVDDEIIKVGDVSVEDYAAATEPKSYRRMDQFDALLQAAAERGRTEVVVRRNGHLIRVPLQAQFGCGGKLALTSSSTRNAWSDGKHIVVTTGMAGLSRSDDEMAFVVAHEMAHNVLGHSGKGKGPRGIFGFSPAKRGEIEADSYAVHLMGNAGYKPAAGILFLQNASRRLWWNISLDHPGFGRRIKTVLAAMEAANRSAAQTTSVAPAVTTPAATRLDITQTLGPNRSFAAISASRVPLGVPIVDGLTRPKSCTP